MIDKYFKEVKPSDYVIEPCGRSGQDSCVSEIGGAFVGQFSDLSLAKMAVKYDMEQKQQNRKLWYRKIDGSLELALDFKGI